MFLIRVEFYQSVAERYGLVIICGVQRYLDPKDNHVCQ